MWAGLIALAAALAAAAAVSMLRRRQAGRLRAAAGGAVVSATDLGSELGQRATLVQFSTQFCARCPATRTLLAQLAGGLDGVAHVEIDAAARPDLARRMRVQTTPTVLVLGPDGTVAQRASGEPRRAELVAALSQLDVTHQMDR